MASEKIIEERTPELIRVKSDAEIVSCDGGGGVFGHPTVFYSFGLKRTLRCGYCGRLFVKDDK